MKKSILNIGKTLNKAEQKSVNGGSSNRCKTDRDCASIPYATCNNGFCD